MTAPAYDPARDLIATEPTPRDSRDLLDRDGAQRLAEQLDAWWHQRGYPNVRHTVEWIGLGRHAGKRRGHVEKSSGVWTVRSNLTNGLPPR
jgi:hypothetical protein